MAVYYCCCGCCRVLSCVVVVVVVVVVGVLLLCCRWRVSHCGEASRPEPQRSTTAHVWPMRRSRRSRRLRCLKVMCSYHADCEGSRPIDSTEPKKCVTLVGQNSTKFGTRTCLTAKATLQRQSACRAASPAQSLPLPPIFLHRPA